jgi:hypothetical protein
LSKTKRGPVTKLKNTSRITIYLDTDVIEAFRDTADASGGGYQTMINEALREYVAKSAQPVDAKTLRRILRDERAGHGAICASGVDFGGIA